MRLTSAVATSNMALKETHTGVVVLTADRAYKAKKPVLTNFLDFRTAEQREHVCAREVLLNSRLAPEAYLGVGHFQETSDNAGEPVIVMRRYPDSRRLAHLVTQGTVAHGDLEQIAEVLAGFHSRALRTPVINTQATVAAITARWEENLRELTRYEDILDDRNIFADIGAAARTYVAGRSALFAQRINERRIVDGHGDLLADDIFCMPNGPILLDCLEFDDRLRYLDCIDDAAFLAMDLEFLGRKDLADYFLDTYSYLSADHAPTSLRDFYSAYRAVVRAKVDCVRFAQGDLDAASRASRHLSIALEHLTTGAVRLALVGGAPGTGKTTLALGLAERVGAEVISTDDVRRELHERGDIEGHPGVLDTGLYSAHNVAAVYCEILSRASVLLSEGQSVILDGTWRDPGTRLLAQQIAEQNASSFVEIMCRTPVETAAARIRDRAASASDATPAMARQLAVCDDAWPAAVAIDTSRTLSDSVDHAERVWRTAAPCNSSMSKHEKL